MAYRIIYEWQKEKELTKRHHLSPGAVLGLMAVAGALAVRLLVPQSAEVFRGLLHPLTDETAIAALGDLVSQVGGGVPLEDAAEAFCREVIGHGQ